VGPTVGAALKDPVALVLPVASLTLVSVALFSRFVRSSATTVLVEDYIRTARAKGVPLRRLVRKHLLRNALSPMVTLFGVSLPFVIGGAIVVESVFNYPGMGLLLWKAATSRDYPLLMGFTLVVGVATVLGNLITDVLYAVVDPRVHYE
jgi:peptide/nickel transport system permease protein